MRRQITTLAAAVRELAQRWKIDGCKAFDEGDTPAEVAEAAGILRCALELSHLLDTLKPAMRASAPEQAEIGSFASQRRAGPGERRTKTRTDRRSRS